MEHLIDWDAWAIEIHEWALGKGWWSDANRNVSEILLLITTEISEAFEHWREGDKTDEIYAAVGGVKVPALSLRVPSPAVWKPDGFQTELADAVIRILDVMPMWEIDIEQAFYEAGKKARWYGMANPAGQGKIPPNVGQQLMYPLRQIMKAWDILNEGVNVDCKSLTLAGKGYMDGMPVRLASACLYIEDLAKHHGFDLENAMRVKHKYNETRAYRHGGKLA